MKIVTKFCLILGFLFSVSLIANSGAMLADRQAGLISGAGNLYLLALLAALFFMQVFIWDRFLYLMKIGTDDCWRKIQMQAARFDEVGTFAKNFGKPRQVIGMGYLLSLAYFMVWFRGPKMLGHNTENPLWYALALIGLGLGGKMWNLIKALKLEWQVQASPSTPPSLTGHA